MTMRIGELARATGESVKTLRFWTEAGLLSASRGHNRYRYYGRGSARRATAIRRIENLGFTLAEIRELLSVREEGVPPCGDVRLRLQERLADTRRRRAELRELERELEAHLAWARAHLDDDCSDVDGICVILDQHVDTAS